MGLSPFTSSFPLLALHQSQITNHQSRYLFPPLSLLTSHGRASSLPVRFQDLFLAFSEPLRVWRFPFRTPAFAKPTARRAVLVLESGC
jgi:hypothetical protein